MARKTAGQLADAIINAAAGTTRHDELCAQREFFNSDSAFVEWHKKADSARSVVQAARLIQRYWKALGLARTFSITLRAVKAALLKLAATGVKITQKLAIAVFESLTGKKVGAIKTEVQQMALLA